MAQPLPYERDYDFEGYQTGHPSTPLPGDKINLELDQVGETIGQILDRIARLQDDDLALKRKSVGYDQLKDELNGFGFEPPTTWATGTAYVERDTVFHDSAFYRCLVSHTAGVFATDLAADKWDLVADFTEATSAAQTAQAAAEAAQSAAETAQAGAVAAENQAVTSAADAATSADNATTSATNASASATAAAGSASDAGASAVAAAASATAAATSEDNAAVSATDAAASASEAAATLAGAVMNTDTATTDMQFVGAGSDLSIDPAKLLKRGDAADAIDAAVTPVVATRTALAAVATADHAAAYLTEAGREGTFLWDSSDLSTYVTADTQQGIYVAPASDTTGASGAWVRVVFLETWVASWFGVDPDDASVSSAVDAMFALANIVHPRWIDWPSGVYIFGAQVRKLAYVWGLRGATSGYQPVVFMKAYVEADNTRGMIHSDDYGGTWHGINFRANSSSSGGALLSFKTTGLVTQNGEIHGSDFVFSGGDYVRYGLYINGETATTGGGGIRDVYLDRFYIFNSASSGLYIKSGQSIHLGIGTVTATGGSGSFGCNIQGTAETHSDNLLVDAVLACNVALSYVSNAIFKRITGDDVSTTNTVTYTKIVELRGGMAALDSGAANWGVGCGVLSTGLHSSGTGWEKRIDGLLRQWGTALVTAGSYSASFPKAFTEKPARLTSWPDTAPTNQWVHSFWATTTAISGTLWDISSSGAVTTGISKTVHWEASGY